MSHTYNPTSVLVTAGGIPLDGLAKDTFIEIAYAEDNVLMRTDVAGSVHYSVSPAQSARVTLTLEPSSNGLALFSGFFTAQKKTGGGAFNFAIIDNNVPDGVSLFTCPQARVAKMPDQSFASEMQAITWEILCGEVTHFIAAIPGASSLPII